MVKMTNIEEKCLLIERLRPTLHFFGVRFLPLSYEFVHCPVTVFNLIEWSNTLVTNSAT
jgi:hypothetical protein